LTISLWDLTLGVLDIVVFLPISAWDLALRNFDIAEFFKIRAAHWYQSALCTDQWHGPYHGAAKAERGVNRATAEAGP